MGRSVLLLVAFSVLAFGQHTRGESRSRTRGQTPTQDPNQTLDRGRLGTEASAPQHPSNWRGLLVDAGCRNRESLNLQQPPSPLPAQGPENAIAKNAAAVSAGSSSAGVTVSQDTLNAERSDIMPHLTPDLVSRQMDPHCAISGATRAFALFLPGGLLLNLDQGGNTMAAAAFQNSPQGQAVLNGDSRSEKPLATVNGRRHGDALVVNTISLQFPPNASPAKTPSTNKTGAPVKAR